MDMVNHTVVEWEHRQRVDADFQQMYTTFMETTVQQKMYSPFSYNSSPEEFLSVIYIQGNLGYAYALNATQGSWVIKFCTGVLSTQGNHTQE